MVRLYVYIKRANIYDEYLRGIFCSKFAIARYKMAAVGTLDGSMNSLLSQLKVS